MSLTEKCEKTLRKYKDYYLDAHNELIIGWDSAPHHTHLDNFPYHKHVGKELSLRSSPKMNLNSVLDFITKTMERSN